MFSSMRVRDSETPTRAGASSLFAQRETNQTPDDVTDRGVGYMRAIPYEDTIPRAIKYEHRRGHFYSQSFETRPHVRPPELVCRAVGRGSSTRSPWCSLWRSRIAGETSMPSNDLLSRSPKGSGVEGRPIRSRHVQRGTRTASVVCEFRPSAVSLQLAVDAAIAGITRRDGLDRRRSAVPGTDAGPRDRTSRRGCRRGRWEVHRTCRRRSVAPLPPERGANRADPRS